MVDVKCSSKKLIQKLTNYKEDLTFKDLENKQNLSFSSNSDNQIDSDEEEEEKTLKKCKLRKA